MSKSSSDRTSQTLLARLRRGPEDKEAWAQFATRYGAVVFSWCRKKGLQRADAEDVTQEIFVDLCKRMRTFEYDPSKSFRKWLSAMTHHAWVDFLERKRRNPPGTGDSAVGALLEAREAPDELAAQLDAAAEKELFEEAASRVRLRVEPQTWQAFSLTAIEKLPAADVAKRLGLSIDSVYQAKSRIVALLREEARRLDNDS